MADFYVLHVRITPVTLPAFAFDRVFMCEFVQLMMHKLIFQHVNDKICHNKVRICCTSDWKLVCGVSVLQKK